MLSLATDEALRAVICDAKESRIDKIQENRKTNTPIELLSFFFKLGFPIGSAIIFHKFFVFFLEFVLKLLFRKPSFVQL